MLQMVGCGSVDDMGLQFIGKGCPCLKVSLNLIFVDHLIWIADCILDMICWEYFN